MRFTIILIVICLAPCWNALRADTPAPDTMLVQRGEATVTLRDFKAALQRIPEEYRAGVATSGQHINNLIAQLLENRLLAVEARQRGLADNDVIQAQIRLKTEQVLATELLDQVVAEHAGDANYEQMAEEYYLTHKPEFMTEPVVSVTHILIGVEDRSEKEAEALAEKVYRKATEAGVPIEKLVLEYSDDPQAANNHGHYADTSLDRFVANFAEAVRELEPGEISQPVKTRFGYHIIKLQAFEAGQQQSFEQVKKELVRRMKKQHADSVRRRFIQGLIEDTRIEANPDAVGLIRETFGTDSAGEGPRRQP